MPTGQTSLSTHSLTFNSNQLQFNVKTTFNDAKELLLNAYNVFLNDLKAMEFQSSEHVYKTDNQISGAAKTNPESETLNVNENCDINKVIINAQILTVGDVYLNLDMDESYELNVTSMQFVLLIFSLYILTNQ